MNGITIAQFIFGLGTILLIHEIWKNKNVLKGYNLLGSFLTWLAMTVVIIQFAIWEDWIGTIAGLVQWIFWLFVVIFVTKIKLFDRKQKKIRKLEDEISSYFRGK